MKVRTRSRLILAAVTFVFLIVLSFITQVVILDSFRTIEKQGMTANIQRVIANLNDQERAVAANCKDWAAGRMIRMCSRAGQIPLQHQVPSASRPFWAPLISITSSFTILRENWFFLKEP